MDNSEFGSNNIKETSSIKYVEVKKLSTQGATCDTFKVRLYGKLHFLKRPHDLHDPHLQDAFKKEFELGFNLDHPRIVKYTHFDRETYSIYNEWIEGLTLTQFIEKNPDYFNSIKHVDRFVAQLTDTIQYLHSRQIIHCDLKPDNLMITDIDHSVKIIDLGCALNDCFDSTTGRTPRFAAPEQLTSGSKIDDRTDVYAIGRIIEYIFKHSKTKPPKRYARVISKCTAHNASDRLSSVIQIQERLKPGCRPMTVVSIIAAILFAIAIIAVVTFSQHSDSPTTTMVDTSTPDTNLIEQPLPATIHDTIEKPLIDTPKELSPAEKLYQAEEEMGMFVAIKGHYELKKEWYGRQYSLFDSLRTEYLMTDSSQRLGQRLDFLLRDFIESEKSKIAQKYPEADAQTIISTGHDIERVILYLCYSDTLLYTDTDKMSQLFYDYAHTKAQLLSSD